MKEPVDFTSDTLAQRDHSSEVKNLVIVLNMELPRIIQPIGKATLGWARQLLLVLSSVVQLKQDNLMNTTPIVSDEVSEE
jgi:hypothetical protein